MGGGSRGALKFVHPAHGVNQLLLAGIERVAGAANFSMQRLHGGTRGKFVAAGAGNCGSCIKLGVDTSFHCGFKLISNFSISISCG